MSYLSLSLSPLSIPVDLNDLQKSQLSHSKEFTLHISEISSLNSSITSLTSSMHGMSRDMAQLETKLNSIKQEAEQVDVNGVGVSWAWLELVI